uniref:Uncharacterized protein n=1 Tax=viral metagenome TaxID=1070528 RepID=A0A6M3IGX7_9ZZZZ
MAKDKGQVKEEEKGGEKKTGEVKADGTVVYSTEAEIAGDKVTDEEGATIGYFDDETAPTAEELMKLNDEELVAEKSDEGDLAAKKKTAEKDAVEKKAAEKGDEEKSDEEKATEKKAAEKDAVEKKAADSDDEVSLEKKGILSDLAKERDARRSISVELAEVKDSYEELKGEIALLKSGKSSDGSTEDKADAMSAFTKKVGELEESIEDNPIQTTKELLSLLKDLPNILNTAERGTEGKLAVKAKEFDVRTKQDTKFRAIVESGMELMQEFVPDILEKETNKKLSLYAKEEGMSNDFLTEITNPGSLITNPDGVSHYVGNDAAYFVKILNNAVLGKGDEVSEEMKAKILEENKETWQTEIREKVTKELLGKLSRGEKITDSTKNIGELPGESDESDLIGQRILSEEEIQALTSSARRKYLGGT